MKSMEEYINEVYEKYEKTEKNHEVYKKVNMKCYNPLTTLCGVAACIALVCVVGMGLQYFNIDKNKELNYASSETKEDGIRVYKEIIRLDDKTSKQLDKLEKDSEYIALTTFINNEKCVHKINNGQVFLETNGILKVNKIFKGNKELETENIKFSKNGGLISFKELQQDESYDWEYWKKVFLREDISEEQESSTYFQQVPSKGVEFEEGKQYLVFLIYDEEEDIYEIFNLAYGVMEYDPSTNLVKNIDTGAFEEFDWASIQKQDYDLIDK